MLTYDHGSGTNIEFYDSSAVRIFIDDFYVVHFLKV